MMLKFDIFECLQINYFAYVHINIFSSVSHCLRFSLSEIICFIWSIIVYSSQRTEMFPRADHMTLSCAITEVVLLLVSYSTMPHLHISQYIWFQIFFEVDLEIGGWKMRLYIMLIFTCGYNGVFFLYHFPYFVDDGTCSASGSRSPRKCTPASQCLITGTMWVNV